MNPGVHLHSLPFARDTYCLLLPIKQVVLDVSSGPSILEPRILVFCPWQEGNISEWGGHLQTRGGLGSGGEGERGRQLLFSTMGSGVRGPVPLSRMGKREKVLKGGDLNCFGDKLHFGQVEFEALTRCRSRDNQEVTRYFHISYSKFKGPLSEKPSVVLGPIPVSFSTLHAPPSQHHLLFFNPLP